MTRSLTLILGVIFAVFAAQTVGSVLVPLVAASGGLSPTVIGLLVAMPLAVGIVVDLPIARVSDLYGRKPSIVTGAFAGTAAAIVLALGDSVLHLALGSLLFGLGLSLLVGPALAFVTELATPSNHHRVQGINGAVQGLSALLGSAAAGVLVAQLGFSAAFAMIAALMVLALGLTIPINESKRANVPSEGQASLPRLVGASYARALWLLVHQPTLLMAAAGASLYGLIFLIVGNAWIPVYLVQDTGLSDADAFALLAVRSVVAAATSLTFPVVVRASGLVPLLVITNIIGVLGLVLVPLLAMSPILIVAFLLQGLGLAFGPATINLLITSATSPAERGVGFSATQMSARVSGVVFPIILGLIASVGGFPMLFASAALLGFALVGLILWLARRQASSPSGLGLSSSRETSELKID